jgi:lysophospholipase L1-like esterase
MQHYVDFVFKQFGTSVVIVPDTTVRVTNAGTQTLATIYSDNGVTEKDNPLTINSNGMYDFYAADGLYDLTFEIPGQPIYRVPNIRLEDPTDENPKFQTNKSLQIVATRGLVPTTAVSVAGVSLHESRLTVKNCDKTVRDVRLLFNGFTVATDASGEVALPNDITVLCAVEKVTPNYAKLGTCYAQTALTVQGGASFCMTEPLGMTLDPSEEFKVQYESRFTASATAQAPQNVTTTLSNTYRSTLATGQVPTAGTWSGIGRDSNQNVGVISGVLGIPSEPTVSVVILGDSIANSRDDSTGDAYGNAGYIPRGLYLAGDSIPFIRATQSGEKVSTFGIGGLTNRLTLLQYCSHVVMNHGTNDIVELGMTLETMQTRYLTAWAMLKARNVQVYQCLIMPRTASTDSWATAANQTPITNFEDGGVRTQVNDWIKTQVGVTIDGYIDPNSAVEDPDNPGKWITNGSPNYPTADGVHPTSAIHALAAEIVAEAAENFVLLGQ